MYMYNTRDEGHSTSPAHAASGELYTTDGFSSGWPPLYKLQSYRQRAHPASAAQFLPFIDDFPFSIQFNN
jgi:hypothetical protein